MYITPWSSCSNNRFGYTPFSGQTDNISDLFYTNGGESKNLIPHAKYLLICAYIRSFLSSLPEYYNKRIYYICATFIRKP